MTNTYFSIRSYVDLSLINLNLTIFCSGSSFSPIKLKFGTSVKFLNADSGY